jgi:uncharacterized protein (TIGR03066 family)
MKTITFRLLCILALFALVLTACGGGAAKLEDQLIGKWEYTDPDINATMTFDFQKEGKLVVSAEGITLDGSYTWEDADTINLVMTFGDESDESLADVKIVEDTLTLTVDGETQELTRVK